MARPRWLPTPALLLAALVAQRTWAAEGVQPVPIGVEPEQPLTVGRREACEGVDEGSGPDTLVDPFDSVAFRANPLPEAFRNSFETAPRSHFSGSGDYLVTLVPYYLGAVLVLTALFLACPCCCGFMRYAHTKHRAPFARTAGIGFHMTFALLSLMVVLNSLVALEEQARASRAYSRAKCSAYRFLDVFVNGGAPEGANESGFVGFRRLEDTIGAASVAYPEVMKRMQEAQYMQPGDTYLKDAQTYYDSWSEDHRRQMNTTAFHCLLCEEESLKPLALSMEHFRNSSARLEDVYEDTKGFIVSTEPLLKEMMNGTLNDTTALYSLGFTYGQRLDDLFGEWQGRWNRRCFAVHALVASSLFSVALGVLCLVLCKEGGCPLIAWWYSYGLTIGLVTLCATLLPVAVAAHEVDDLLRVILTEQGIEAYSSSILQGLSATQRSALATCVTAAGDGSLGPVLNLAVEEPQAQEAERLVGTLATLGDEVRLNTSSLDAFFGTYEHADGTDYLAAWNASQSLAWQGQADGLAAITEALFSLSGEHWAFEGAQAPDGCPAAMRFDPNSPVEPVNCFLVESGSPPDEEVERRYKQLTPAQMQILTRDFDRARSAATALRYAAEYTEANKAEDLHNAWEHAASELTNALDTVKAAVAGPMRQKANSVLQMARGTNCKESYRAYLRGASALGHDFVKAHVVLWVCFSMLAFSVSGLTGLYCMLWGMRHRGSAEGFSRRHRKKRLLEPEGAMGVQSDGEGSPSDDEDAERQPLTKSWRNSRG